MGNLGLFFNSELSKLRRAYHRSIAKKKLTAPRVANLHKEHRHKVAKESIARYDNIARQKLITSKGLAGSR
jgi:hypothetical protein